MTAASTPSSESASPTAAGLAPGRPLVFRNATVLTMDDAHHVVEGADVLVEGDRITAVFNPMKEGGGRGGSLFYIILPDGHRLYSDIARPKPGT